MTTSDSRARPVSLYLCDKVTGLQLHTELCVYVVASPKRCCLCGDRLLSAVVDGTQLKLQQQMEKHYREAFRATSHAPRLCAAAAAYI